MTDVVDQTLPLGHARILSATWPFSTAVSATDNVTQQVRSPRVGRLIRVFGSQPKVLSGLRHCLRAFRYHRPHFGNRERYGADVSAWSILARMATSVSGKTTSLVDVSSSIDHQRWSVITSISMGDQ
jgi:hypothetical protein